MKTVLNVFLIALSWTLFNGTLSKTPSKACLNDFRKYALNAHNVFRNYHRTPPLKSNISLTTMAQKYANFLAESNLFKHSYSGYGENLARAAFTYSQNINCRYWAVYLTSQWYREISLYNFNYPRYYHGTGHFTQIVWKSTTQVGIGLAIVNRIVNNRNATVLYYVANYLRPGNVRSQFAKNVLRVY
ncbi:secretion [Brachionus plicatilis]|uniref:Secretion n=1 Tax=Brachionus plicatilis TaxID=10195 RepID=A0A3M7QF62_BRAPC|nr:secretion [Brachionus plicatilis]